MMTMLGDNTAKPCHHALHSSTPPRDRVTALGALLRSRSTGVRWTRAVLCFAFFSVFWIGCAGESDGPGGDDSASMERALETYLPLLGEAYETGDLRPLEGHAALREIASVDRRIKDISSMGRVLKASFKELTIEDINAWNHSNAYITTLEVWDLRTYAAGSDVVLAEEIDQATRVKYQVKREGDSWLVLFRAIQQ